VLRRSNGPSANRFHDAFLDAFLLCGRPPASKQTLFQPLKFLEQLVRRRRHRRLLCRFECAHFIALSEDVKSLEHEAIYTRQASCSTQSHVRWRNRFPFMLSSSGGFGMHVSTWDERQDMGTTLWSLQRRVWT